MSEDNFASMFESQTKASKQRSVRIGETLEAIVVQVGRDAVFFELDGKKQAYIDIGEVRGAEGAVEVKVGDKVVAKVLAVDEKTGIVRLGKSMGRASSVGDLERAKEARVPVEGKVSGVNKGGIEVELGGGNRGFCPTSQLGKNVALDSLVGQKLEFLVLEIKEGGRSIVLSRRAMFEEETRAQRERVLATLTKGQIVNGTVTAVRDFGAFVDLGGLEALIPASEISHERRGPVADSMKAGDTVTAQVLDIKQDEKGGTKVSLSLRALAPAPEGMVATKAIKGTWAIGQKVTGKVVRIENYGLFVQVEGTEGRDGRGLIPNVETGVPRGGDLRKLFPEGTELTARIVEMAEGKLKLSLRAAKDAAEREDYEAHRDSAKGARNFGTLGDLLKKAGK
ncbi:MAG: S1 RNA-binding domain-containing protein [Polyangiaceae bacterium]|nr:S1 RNA-binding domain-containing protein [Polyangiaceae bacterium]